MFADDQLVFKLEKNLMVEKLCLHEGEMKTK